MDESRLGFSIDDRAAEEVRETGLEPAPSDPGPRIWTVSDLCAAELPQPEGYLNGRILCPGSAAVIAGAAGVGKTWLLLWLAAAVARGRDFGPLPTKETQVLVVSEEMDEAEIKDRLSQLFSQSERDELGDRIRFVFQTGFQLDSPSELARLRATIERSGSPGLVLADALSDLKGGAKENSNDDMGRVLRGVRGVARDTGSAIALLHHYGKPDELKSGVDLIRGASAIRDICADILTVAMKRGTDRVVKFAKVRHGSEPPPFTFSIESDGNGGPVTIAFREGAPVSDFENAGLVIQTVKEEGGRLNRQTLIGILNRKRSWSENTAQKYIEEAKSSGLLKQPDKVGREVFYEAD